MFGALLPTLACPRATPLLPRLRSTAASRIAGFTMASGGGGAAGGGVGGGEEAKAPSIADPNPQEKFAKVQKLLGKNPRDGWKECWEKGLIPWDLGKPTPIVLHLLGKGCLPKGRAFIPGCGTGYDVAAIADPERYVVGLDISEVAVKKAWEMHASSENSDFFTFMAADFFTWHPSELFDLVIDYTFFCAIEPSLRSTWASRMLEILKPEGELITIMFPIGDFDGGPPYAISVSIYEEVLHPLGFEAISVVDNELAVGPRKVYEIS